MLLPLSAYTAYIPEQLGFDSCKWFCADVCGQLIPQSHQVSRDNVSDEMEINVNVIVATVNRLSLRQLYSTLTVAQYKHRTLSIVGRKRR